MTLTGWVQWTTKRNRNRPALTCYFTTLPLWPLWLFASCIPLFLPSFGAYIFRVFRTMIHDWPEFLLDEQDVLSSFFGLSSIIWNIMRVVESLPFSKGNIRISSKLIKHLGCPVQRSWEGDFKLPIQQILVQNFQRSRCQAVNWSHFSPVVWLGSNFCGRLGVLTPWKRGQIDLASDDLKLIFSSSSIPRNQGKMSCLYLVGGLEHFLFSHILGMIIPID